LITGASSGFGEMTAYALADAGYTVFASMRDTAGRNAPKVAQALDYSRKNRVDLRCVELDVTNQNSVDHAVAEIIRQVGCIEICQRSDPGPGSSGREREQTRAA
jgi:NAD(P)-dependent dehydrogenase (short-subunit alcohol dehydrogenase family)